MSKAAQAAAWLLQEHERRERFRPLPPELAPETSAEAYSIQEAFVALRAQKRGAAVGYKIALSSAAMRRFVGVDSPQAGVLLESTVRRSPARIRAADYVNCIIEFEIAVELADDLPAADAPFSRQQVAGAVGAVMAALEIADDRSADYSRLAQHPLHLIADNAWNEGAVLGRPVPEWQKLQLERLKGIASVNGAHVGEGVGADAMGHPLDAVVWIADHLASRGYSLLRRDVVITGSIVTSKRVKAGDVVRFELENLGGVELRIE
jgi:2-oxo-3-hexenedioate decarboxylase/2-keto-4-pentenoate hydratase